MTHGLCASDNLRRMAPCLSYTAAPRRASALSSFSSLPVLASKVSHAAFSSLLPILCGEGGQPAACMLPSIQCAPPCTEHMRSVCTRRVARRRTPHALYRVSPPFFLSHCLPFHLTGRTNQVSLPRRRNSATSAPGSASDSALLACTRACLARNEEKKSGVPHFSSANMSVMRAVQPKFRPLTRCRHRREDSRTLLWTESEKACGSWAL